LNPFDYISVETFSIAQLMYRRTAWTPNRERKLNVAHTTNELVKP